MNEFKKSLLLTLRWSAIEAAVNPAMHAYTCSQRASTPITREWVVDRYGEATALAWDDLQAASKSFHREAKRFVNGVQPPNC
jgi:hypothetical protein